MRTARKLLVLVVAVAGTVSTGAARADHQDTISGTITNEDGEPIESICVDLYVEDDEGWYRTGETETGVDGVYQLDTEPGEYKLHFSECWQDRYLPEWYDDKPTRDSADVISVSGDVPGLDAVLALGGSISGRVTTELDEPLDSVCVGATDGGGDLIQSDYTDEFGNYTVGALATGTYKVVFRCREPYSEPAGSADPIAPASHGASRYVREWYVDAPSAREATPVAVIAGVETPGIDASLAFGGSISGTVAKEDGGVVEYPCASAFDASSRIWIESGSGSDGSYLIGGLPTGNYKVEISDCDGWEYEPEWYDDAETFHLATTIPVTLGVDTVGIDAALTPVPLPDLAVDLDIESAELRTDVASVPGPGTQRAVNVKLANIGDAEAYYARLLVWVEMGGRDRRTYLIVDEDFSDIAAGREFRRSYAWNGLGTFGEATVHASLCTYSFERNYDNNRASVRHYVVAGGTGVSVALRRGDYVEDYCWDEWGARAR